MEDKDSEIIIYNNWLWEPIGERVIYFEETKLIDEPQPSKPSTKAGT